MKLYYVNEKYFIDTTLIKERIFNEELFEYKIEDREELIDNLIMWISECSRDRQSDKQLMKNDLKYLMNIDDELIFSSISTNEYIVEGDSNFEETCINLLEINKKLN